jgi:hypothetical protein
VRHNIVKAEEVVNSFAAFFDAKEEARILGISLKDAWRGAAMVHERQLID